MKKTLYCIIGTLIVITLTSCSTLFTASNDAALNATFENVIADSYYKTEITELCNNNGIKVYYSEANRISSFEKGALGFDLNHNGDIKFYLTEYFYTSDSEKGNLSPRKLTFRCFGETASIDIPKECVESDSEYHPSTQYSKSYYSYTDSVSIEFDPTGSIAKFINEKWVENKSLYIDYEGRRKVTLEYGPEYHVLLDLVTLIEKEFNKTEDDLNWNYFENL